MHFAGWILMVFGLAGAAGLLFDSLREGFEEDRIGGMIVGFLICGVGASLVFIL